MKTLRGFSLPTAIFLLVILALLGAFMVSLSTTQNVMSAQDVQGSRAYNAARAGMEWALYNLKPDGRRFRRLGHLFAGHPR
jgi:MSHA biogenesis protein MshP